MGFDSGRFCLERERKKLGGREGGMETDNLVVWLVTARTGRLGIVGGVKW